MISQEQEYGLKSEVKMCAWSSVHTCNCCVQCPCKFLSDFKLLDWKSIIQLVMQAINQFVDKGNSLVLQESYHTHI